jgi:hypothetical protein
MQHKGTIPGSICRLGLNGWPGRNGNFIRQGRWTGDGIEQQAATYCFLREMQVELR